MLSLPDDNPEFFRIFAKFIYIGKLDNIVTTAGHAQDSDTGSDERSEKDNTTMINLVPMFEKLVDLFIFGVGKLADRFQDAVMEQLAEAACSHAACLRSSIDKIYSNTKEGSPLRQLVLDCAMFYDGSNDLVSELEAFPLEFLTELVYEAVEFARQGWKAIDPATTHRCRYHVHDGEVADCPPL